MKMVSYKKAVFATETVQIHAVNALDLLNALQRYPARSFTKPFCNLLHIRIHCGPIPVLVG